MLATVEARGQEVTFTNRAEYFEGQIESLTLCQLHFQIQSLSIFSPVMVLMFFCTEVWFPHIVCFSQSESGRPVKSLLCQVLYEVDPHLLHSQL